MHHPIDDSLLEREEVTCEENVAEKDRESSEDGKSQQAEDVTARWWSVFRRRESDGFATG